MKYILNLQLSLIFILFITTNEQKLDLRTYYSDRVTIQQNGGWYDIHGLEVTCPNEGIIKNFVLRKENNQIFYEYQCYSSVSPDEDYGEPIIKRLTLTTSYDGSYTQGISPHLSYINGLSCDCWPDYGLHNFTILVYNVGYGNYNINRRALCHGIKSSYTSPMNIQTQPRTGNAYSLDTFVDVLVGSTEQETDEIIGYPLRGFKYVVNYNRWNTNEVTTYYIYSYAKLRNMKVVRDSYQQRFEELRKSNTQKN